MINFDGFEIRIGTYRSIPYYPWDSTDHYTKMYLNVFREPFLTSEMHDQQIAVTSSE